MRTGRAARRVLPRRRTRTPATSTAAAPSPRPQPDRAGAAGRCRPTTTSGTSALGVNGGGIAGLGVVGGDYKAGGCTGLPSPTGDFYAIDYVAHELGHQIARQPHLRRRQLVSCARQPQLGRASVEPGSGSSVMAYAGICGQDDLQPHSDPYFSFKTLDEIDAYTGDTPRGKSRCRRCRCAASTPTARRSSSATTARRRPDAWHTYTKAGIGTLWSRSPAERHHRRVGLRRGRGPRRERGGNTGPIDGTGFTVLFEDELTVREPTTRTSTSRR